MELILNFLVIIGIFFGVKVIRSYRKGVDNEREINKKNILKKTKKVIGRHAVQLGIERVKLIYKDAYGNEIVDNWYKKGILYFVEKNLYKELTNNELNYIHLIDAEVFQLIDEAAIKFKPINMDFDEDMNGFEFEEFCALKLREKGWKVNKTRNGADQGVDLIIEKGKRKIAVQCKKYKHPIGNKAIQEVKAGISHYDLIEGVVLSNTTYTRSAIELANTNNIKLLHFLEVDLI